MSHDPACAGGPCGCYCGIYLPAPCSDDACKRACGWQDPGGSVPPSYDDSAERQRQEAERRHRQEAEKQRQIELKELLKREEEAAKQRHLEFEKNKQEALKNMKGITESGPGLKGTVPESDHGLKGVEKTSSDDLGLKTLFDKGTHGSAPVDFRVKGPSKLDVGNEEGTTRAVKAPLDTQRYFRSPEADKELVRLFLSASAPRAQTSGNKGLFPKNPEEPLINPLREPERFKAWEKSVQASLEARIKKDRAEKVIKKMDRDRELNNARDRIVRTEEKTINLATAHYGEEANAAFKKLSAKYGVDDVFETGKNNPEFQRRAQAILEDYWKKVDEAGLEARRRSLQEMDKEVKKAFKRYGIAGKGGAP